MDIDSAVDLVWAYRQQGRHYPPELQGQLDIPQAYRVELGLLARFLAAGETHVGWKVGVTAKAMQQQVGVTEPVFGFLLDSGMKASGVCFRRSDLIEPRIENELCITIGRTLRGPGVNFAQARDAIDGVAPALEVVEKRGVFSDITMALSDNIEQKAFVTGAAVSVRGTEFDLSRATVEVVIDGTTADRAAGAEVMGNPVNSIVWLANKLAEFDLALEAGMRVMSGSFTKQYAVAHRVESRFDPFGTVVAEFA